MASSSWPGVRQIRRLFSHPHTTKLNINLDLAEMGSAERVRQCAALRNELEILTEEATDAFKQRQAAALDDEIQTLTT